MRGGGGGLKKSPGKIGLTSRLSMTLTSFAESPLCAVMAVKQAKPFMGQAATSSQAFLF